MAPLDFWRGNDPPDRQGMTEIRYIEGLYALWDEPRGRHPGLLIDDCASGGRRIDLEMISRSVAPRSSVLGGVSSRMCRFRRGKALAKASLDALRRQRENTLAAARNPARRSSGASPARAVAVPWAPGDRT